MTASDREGGPGSDPTSVRRVLLVAKIGPEGGARIASDLGAWLSGRGIEVFHERETARALERRDGVSLDGLPTDVDLAIVAGSAGHVRKKHGRPGSQNPQQGQKSSSLLDETTSQKSHDISP